MKKRFVIEVEYPDCDTIPSDEIIEVTKESFEYILSRYFGANIMDGDYDRIKVKEISDKTMIDRATQWLFEHVYDYTNPEDQERVEKFRKYLED